MRSSAPALVGDFAIIGEGSCFCSTVTGILGRTALGAKKISNSVKLFSKSFWVGLCRCVASKIGCRSTVEREKEFCGQVLIA